MSFRTLTESLKRPLTALNVFSFPRPAHRKCCALTALGAAAALLLPMTAGHAHPMTRHEQRIANHLAHITRHRQSAQARIAALQGREQLLAARLGLQRQALTSRNVVMAAYAFRGTRYVMGGTSRSGFDCSGFVRYILGNAGGVSLPRTAVEQYWHGAPVATPNLQPGDLVFFKNTYKRGISHVGIYAGAGRFIHAANPHRGVQMDSLNSAYYAHHFAGARRVLPAQMRAMAALPQ